MQVLAPSLLSSQGVVHSLGVVACYSDYSSINSSDCSDYSDCFSILDLHSDSDFGICYDMNCLYTALAMVDSANSHIKSALLPSTLTDTPYCCVVHCKIHKFPTYYSE